MIQKPKLLLRKSSFWEKYQKKCKSIHIKPRIIRTRTCSAFSFSPVLLFLLFSLLMLPNPFLISTKWTWFHAKNMKLQVPHIHQPKFLNKIMKNRQEVDELTLILKGDLRICEALAKDWWKENLMKKGRRSRQSRRKKWKEMCRYF